jgi:hypothetical protein
MFQWMRLYDLISESNGITRQERLHCGDSEAYSTSGPKLIYGILGAGAVG